MNGNFRNLTNGSFIKIIPKEEYFQLSTYEGQTVLSNSLLGLINPDQGGSQKKFEQYLENGFEQKEGLYIENGRLYHSYKENQDQFAIEPENKPTETTAKWAEMVHEVLADKEDVTELEYLEASYHVRDQYLFHKKLKDKEKIKIKALEGYPYFKFLRENNDKSMITAAQKETLTNMMMADKEFSTGEELYESGEGISTNSEFGILFYYRGHPVKVLIDKLQIDSKQKDVTIIDYKTISSSASTFMGYNIYSPDTFGMPVKTIVPGLFSHRHIYRQVALYREGVRAYLKELDHKDYRCNVTVRVLETKDCFDVKDYVIHSRWLSSGMSEVDQIIYTFNRYYS